MYKKSLKRLNGIRQTSNGRRANRLDALRGLLRDAAKEVEAIGRRKPELEAPLDFYKEIERFEIELIASALRRTGGHQKRAATLLGMQYTTLNSKIKKLGIPLVSNQGAMCEELPEEHVVTWNN